MGNPKQKAIIKIRDLALTLMVCLLLVAPASAQDTLPELHINKDYLLSAATDAANIAIAPVGWDGRQWLGFAAFTGVTLVLFTQDEAIRDFYLRNHTTAQDNISKYALDPLGKWYLAGLLGGMYIYGVAANDGHTETAALLTGKAVLLTGGYTLLLKSLFQRERPYAGDPANPNTWNGPLGGWGDNSFPSGHSSVAFAAAAVLSAYYHERRWVGITAFSLASLVALSRTYDDQHWASDVFAGAALGYAVGRLVYNNYQKQKITVTPFSSSGFTGLTLSYTFR
ncbi:MAG: phosphatase PAP2 family protein [Bacteroidales bacterium]|nr:phosphatase PAP2 family protein [Bacteroidales bacterium]MDD3525477.1 phosphatase PAP2 family protein [Bacteroidales bacterium]MDD4175876.1 phosphatase PAP2 family protein [Bacteroidales bacterium]MDD4740028.1 phosphatase PAP2 family protein [Bacteroidales bacterium]